MVRRRHRRRVHVLGQMADAVKSSRSAGSSRRGEGARAGRGREVTARQRVRQRAACSPDQAAAQLPERRPRAARGRAHDIDVQQVEKRPAKRRQSAPRGCAAPASDRAAATAIARPAPPAGTGSSAGSHSSAASRDTTTGAACSVDAIPAAVRHGAVGRVEQRLQHRRLVDRSDHRRRSVQSTSSGC